MLSCSQVKFTNRQILLAHLGLISSALILASGFLLFADTALSAQEEKQSTQPCPEVEAQSSQLPKPPSPTVDAIDSLTNPSKRSNNSPLINSAQPAKSSSKKKLNKKLRGTPPCLAWIDPSKTPKAVLLCVHGLGLYNGTYEPFGKLMAANGIATYAIDMRGFGSWMEAKGREKVDFAACFEDVKAVLRVIHRAHPGLPVFLLGESMGGAIALQATAMYPELIDGLISSVPAADRFQQKRTALKVALHLLANPDKPFNVGTGVIKQATKKSDLRQAWGKDPLARLNLSPRELLQFQKFMNQNHDRACEIKTTPVLIIQGAGDKLVRPEGTVELYNELSTPDRQLVLVPNAEHLIFEENQFNQETFALVLKWIEDRIKTHEASVAEPTLNKLP